MDLPCRDSPASHIPCSHWPLHSPCEPALPPLTSRIRKRLENEAPSKGVVGSDRCGPEDASSRPLLCRERGGSPTRTFTLRAGADLSSLLPAQLLELHLTHRRSIPVCLSVCLLNTLMAQERREQGNMDLSAQGLGHGRATTNICERVPHPTPRFPSQEAQSYRAGQ